MQSRNFYKLQAEIARILRHMPEVSNQYFDSREEIPKEERKIGSVVITGDKGLAGAYNHNVAKSRRGNYENAGTSQIVCRR